jgi:hypothetical protein
MTWCALSARPYTAGAAAAAGAGAVGKGLKAGVGVAGAAATKRANLGVAKVGRCMPTHG